LPPVKPPQKNMKPVIRYAGAKISEVQSYGLLTISMSEPVNLIDYGNKIDP
jgi:hypothetical protein